MTRVFCQPVSTDVRSLTSFNVLVYVPQLCAPVRPYGASWCPAIIDPARQPRKEHRPPPRRAPPSRRRSRPPSPRRRPDRQRAHGRTRRPRGRPACRHRARRRTREPLAGRPRAPGRATYPALASGRPASLDLRIGVLAALGEACGRALRHRRQQLAWTCSHDCRDSPLS